jgi:hypothetical protein
LITGADAADFVITSPAFVATTLAPDESFTVSVAFDPSTSGQKGASLTVISDDSDESTVDVGLSALAVEGFTAATGWDMFY